MIVFEVTVLLLNLVLYCIRIVRYFKVHVPGTPYVYFKVRVLVHVVALCGIRIYMYMYKCTPVLNL